MRRTTIDKNKTAVVLGINHLALVDLPEDTLLLSRIVEALGLPIIAVPIFIAGEICNVLPRNSCQVDIGRLFRMPIRMDVITKANGPNVTVPWLCLTIPPILTQPPCRWCGRVSVCDVDRRNSRTDKVVDAVRTVVEQEIHDA